MTKACDVGSPAVVLSHPTGNQNVRNALKSLVERDMLAEFWTTISWDAESPWNRLLPSSVRVQLKRRAFEDMPGNRMRCVPWREIVRLSAWSSPLTNLLCSGERPFSVIGMYRHFDGRVARNLRNSKSDVVYAYEGGALQTFREARRLGKVTIHEQPSSYWYWARRLLAEEAERNPEFAGLLPTLIDPIGHLEWKDEELSLADYVLVPSEHVRRTLVGVVPDEKIRVVSYGAPPVRARKPISLESSKPLQILFVGALAQHKGIGYLLSAIDMLEAPFELTMIGKRFAPNDRVDAACNRWRWFDTLPHNQVLDRMTESDVLVLPSLSEGFGLVVTEALACGLPVIVTSHVGARDLIQDGREGFVVPAASAGAIAERLSILSGDRETLAEMSRNAYVTATDQSWQSYRARWADAVRAVSCH